MKVLQYRSVTVSLLSSRKVRLPPSRRKHSHGVLMAIRCNQYVNFFHCPSETSCMSLLNCADVSSRFLSVTKTVSEIDEDSVLHELSNLLPIRSNSGCCTQRHRDEPDSDREADGKSVADVILTPAEKLRGVFLQNLNGKFAIERALSDTGVELSSDVVAEVLNWGNLGAKSMLLFFDWAVKHDPRLKPHDDYVCCYNLLLRALARRKFVEMMMEVLWRLPAQDVNPNLETLSIVADGLAKARRVKRAVNLFDELKDLGFGFNTECVNVILKSLCDRSHVGAACSWFNRVGRKKMELDKTTYNILVGGWSRHGRVDETERIIEAMTEDGFAPDCFTFSCLIECLGRARRIDDAIEIFHHLEERGCVADATVHNAMISNFISVGDLDKTMDHYRNMLRGHCDPNHDTYVKLISALIRERRIADALELFDEMLGRGIDLRTGTLTCFIEPLCNFGPPHAALELYKKARKYRCRVSVKAYKLLLKRLSRFGKCGILLTVWKEMEEDGYCTDAEVYESVINGLCNTGKLANSVLVMEESMRKGLCPSRLICSKLSKKLLASNKVEVAYRLFLKIKEARRHENAQKFWRSNGWHF